MFLLYNGLNFDKITLDEVADLNIVKVFYRNTAFESLRNFFNVVFETFKLIYVSFADHNVVSVNTKFSVSDDLAFGYVATRNHSDARNFERLTHLGFAHVNFLRFGSDKTFHRVLYVVYRFVNNSVKPYIDLASFCQSFSFGIGTNVESDYNRIGRIGKHYVRFVDRSDRRMDYIDLNFLVAKFGKRLFYSLNRTLYVCFYKNIESFEVSVADFREKIVQSNFLRLFYHLFSFFVSSFLRREWKPP